MDNTKIEWCDSTWNPVTGCLHGCDYCYARKIATRFGGFEPRCGGENIPEEKRPYGKNSVWNHTHGQSLHVFNKQPMKRNKAGEFKKTQYPYAFEPTLHRYRLGEPARKTKPQTVFVCSMADLFGSWIPDDWIEEVFRACLAVPQHLYLFLTKNPNRYIDLYAKKLLPDAKNIWFGSTITTQDDIFMWSENLNTFVSIEPISGEFEPSINGLKEADWVIIGAETGNRKGKVIPQREWIENIVASCKEYGIPVFMKDSLADIWGEPLLREFPWVESGGNI